MAVETLNQRTKWAIDYVIKREHLSNIKLAAAMGSSSGAINSYRRMTTLPNIEFILKFCELFQFSLLWFAEGIGYPFKDAWITHPESKGPKPVPKPPDIPGLFGPEADAPFVPLRTDGLSNEFVFIPQKAGPISAGGGLIPDNTVEMRVAFRRDWIARKGLPENMSLIKVDGDSMAPTLLSGDLVLVDHGRDYVASQGGIYAISVDHEIMIKRVQPVFPDKILIISDNKQYPPQEIDADKVTINGKVLWFAREMER